MGQDHLARVVVGTMSSDGLREFSIGPFGVDMIEEALSFCRLAGWNQLESDWRRMVNLNPAGCFVAMIGTRLVGTVTTTCYGRELAWIGMMLVDPTYRRMGIATALMRTAIATLQQRSIECIKLDATPAGELVYSRLGFRTQWSFQRWQRPASVGEETSDALSTSGNRQLPCFDSAARAMDRRAFGADRYDYLMRLANDSHVVTHEHGFGMLRSGFLADYLGPVTVSDSAAARSVINDLLCGTGRPVFWDVPGPNPSAIQLAHDFGFAPVRELKRMSLGANDIAADTDQQFAMAGPATG